MGTETEHADNILLDVRHLKKYFPMNKGFFGKSAGDLKAVDDVSFTLEKGQVLGLVGRQAGLVGAGYVHYVLT